MPDPMFLLLVALAAVAVFLMAAAERRRQQEHLHALRQWATQLGWGFTDSLPLAGIPVLDRFELFKQGRQRTLSGLMTSRGGDPRIVVFDYSYVTGYGKHRRTHRQTVFYVKRDQLALPTFSLRPEHFFDRLATAFGYVDIDLDGHPEFSRSFLLRVADETTARRTFTDDVVAFFERREGTCCAGTGRELLFWRPDSQLQPAERHALIDEGLDLASRFTKRTSIRS